MRHDDIRAWNSTLAPHSVMQGGNWVVSKLSGLGCPYDSKDCRLREGKTIGTASRTHKTRPSSTTEQT